MMDNLDDLGIGFIRGVAYAAAFSAGYDSTNDYVDILNSSNISWEEFKKYAFAHDLEKIEPWINEKAQAVRESEVEK